MPCYLGLQPESHTPALPLPEQHCRRALLESVDQRPALQGKVVTGGRLNVARALARLTGKPDPAPITPSCECGAHWAASAGWIQPVACCPLKLQPALPLLALRVNQDGACRLRRCGKTAAVALLVQLIIGPCHATPL